MSDLNIYQRINAVQKKVAYIKRGSAGQGTGVLYDEVVSEIRKEMVAQGIVITTHQQSPAAIVRDAKQPIFAVNIIDLHPRLIVFVQDVANQAGETPC